MYYQLHMSYNDIIMVMIISELKKNVKINSVVTQACYV